MKLKYLAISTFAIFLISLLFSASIIQAQTQILTETRKSAIVKALTQKQLRKWAEFEAMILIIFKILDALKETNITEAIVRIVSQQNVTIDNVTLWGWPAKFGESLTYVTNPHRINTCLTALRLVNALNQVNKEALIEMALSRYNESDGAFHEPVFKIEYSDGRIENRTITGFPLEFYAISDLAYAESNIISTFEWISILAQLNALDKINTTKTLEWILSCKAENGAFKPFPESSPEYLPPWSSLRTNPFYVDRYGTGLAYTYAAISTLKILGYLKDNNAINREKIKEYVFSCLVVTTRDTAYFKAHPDDKRGTVGIGARQYNYYAVKTLECIGMLEESMSELIRVRKYLLEEYQNLYYRDSWLLPNRLWNATWKENTWADVYGLFGGSFTPVQATYYAVLTLNLTKSLHFLNQLTPAALKAWYNLTILSLVISGISVLGILIYKEILRKGKNEKAIISMPL